MPKYPPSKVSGRMQSEKAPIPKKVLPPPAPAKVKRIGKKPKNL